VQWDIQWHLRVGRDSFWIAPHVLIYGGVSLIALLSFGLLARDTFRQRPASDPARTVRVLGLTGTPALHLAAWGIAVTLAAAPVDELWHRLFGRDVSLWSPPHVMAFLGAAVNSAAGLLLAREVYPDASRARLVATLAAGALFYRDLHFMLEEAPVVAYLYGGVRFHTFAMLAALVLPLTLVTTARFSGRRWAPIGLAVVALLTGLAGAVVAETGFALLRPVSAIGDEVASDPTSPVAVANVIARENGTPPGRRLPVPGLVPALLVTLVPVAVMTGIDARRRPLAASAGYALALFVASGWSLGGQPAFRTRVPGTPETLVAVLIALAAAVAGGLVARRVSPAGAR
jgi:hypothetical protein